MSGFDGSTSLPPLEGWTYKAVEERLVEAMACWRRVPDPEQRWLHVGGNWPSIVRDRCLGDYDARGYMGTSDDIPLRPLSLARREVERMLAASEWLALYVEERDRQLVAIVLSYKASDRRPPWKKINLRLGGQVSPDALARRYERAHQAHAGQSMPARGLHHADTAGHR